MSSDPTPMQHVSVVIPVLNAEVYLTPLFESLKSQKPTPPKEILLVDSMSTDRTRELGDAEEGVRVIPIADFSHGRARNLGVREASGDIIVLMTQDAIPADESWLSNLIQPLGQDDIVASFSRQVPRPGASPMECFYLAESFPAGAPVVRRKAAGETLAMSDIFFSNVSSAYLRDALIQFPFEEDLIMGEDQQFARDALSAGQATAYQPSSVVVHSHTFPLKTVFRRYFDTICAFQGILSGFSIRGNALAGFYYLLRESRFILRHHPLTLPNYLCYVAAKTSGVAAGRFSRWMPTGLLRKLSLHSYHWNRSGS